MMLCVRVVASLALEGQVQVQVQCEWVWYLLVPRECYRLGVALAVGSLSASASTPPTCPGHLLTPDLHVPQYLTAGSTRPPRLCSLAGKAPGVDKRSTWPFADMRWIN